MEFTNDFTDILGVEGTKLQGSHLQSVLNDEKKKKPKKVNKLPAPNQFKKPEGMARELFNLLRDGSTGSLAQNQSGIPLDKSPLIQADTKLGYKLTKAKMSKFHPRAWKQTPFAIPMRDDGIVFFHWKRECDGTGESQFARFNKHVNNPSYTSVEYAQYLNDSSWSEEETAHLMDLCNQFDTRFIIIQDRYDSDKFRHRSIEDLKERYYNIVATLQHVRSGNTGEPPKLYDAAHERKRKEQLERLWNRTPEEVKEEERLVEELKKIETRKREREKKAQDLQKLISAVDSRPKSQPSQLNKNKSVFKDSSQKKTLQISSAVPITKKREGTSRYFQSSGI